MKRCWKCGETKDISAFGKDASRWDGLQARCKACIAIYTALHREEIAAYRARYNANEEVKAKRSAYDAAYYAAHREEIAAYRAAYYAEHPGKRATYNAAWVRANPDKNRAKRHRRRANVSGNGGNHTPEDIQRQGESQRWKCWWCGKKCKEKHHVDHLIPISRGGHNNPSNLVISCPTCNLKKHNKTPDEFCGKLF